MDSEALHAIGFLLGKMAAEDLRKRACKLDDTEIINEEVSIPEFKPSTDYSAWPVGSPVKFGEQIWKLVKPYDGVSQVGSPEDLRGNWQICHTKNEKKAKPWAGAIKLSRVPLDESNRKISGFPDLSVSKITSGILSLTDNVTQTVGSYMQGECYRAFDGTVYRAKRNNLELNAEEAPDDWEAVM